MQLLSLLTRIPFERLKEPDNFLIAAAMVLGVVGLFVDETIRRLAPLIAVIGLAILAAHLIHRRRMAAELHHEPAKD